MNTITEILQRHQPDFHQVVHLDAEKDKLLLMDFTANNKKLTEDNITNTEKFIVYINQELQSAHAKFGIGGYKENRQLYGRSKVFDSETGEEPRRLH